VAAVIDAGIRASYNLEDMSTDSPISRFENFARGLIEGSFDRLLRQPGPVSLVANALIIAAESRQSGGLAAGHYVVSVHPDTLAELQRQSSDIESFMEAMLANYGERNNLIFDGEVRVEMLPDASVAQGQPVATAWSGRAEEEPTAVLRRRSSTVGSTQEERSPDRRGSTAPLKLAEAYLIVNGRRHVMLQKAVNTIGRSLENDIVLEDQGVSRSHAQIRWRNGRFEIFDLGSRAGTLVNGQELTRRQLRSGDVITLGAAALIYGEEDHLDGNDATPRKSSTDITQELSAGEPS
jgi:hypothetical protein